MSGYGMLKVIEGKDVYHEVKYLVIDGCTQEMKLHRWTSNKHESEYFSLTEDAIITVDIHKRYGIKLTTKTDLYHINRYFVENGSIHVDVKNKQVHLHNTLKTYVGNVFWQVSIDFADITRIESTNRYQEDITQQDLQKKRDLHISEHSPMHNNIHDKEKIVHNF